MISVTPATACLLYLAIALLALLGAWLTDRWRSRNYQASILARQRYVCEFCQYSYLEDPQHHVNKCPQCGSLNREEIAKAPISPRRTTHG